MLGKANGWPHHVGKFHGAVGFQCQRQACNGTGNRDGSIADRRCLFVERAVGLDIHVACGFTGGHFAVVEKRCLAAGKSDQHESAAADISRSGFDNGEGERGGDGGVHGVSTVLQDIRTHLRGLRGQRLIGGNHAMRGTDWLARPLFRNVRVIAEFRGGLAASLGRKSGKKEGERQNREKSSTHG